MTDEPIPSNLNTTETLKPTVGDARLAAALDAPAETAPAVMPEPEAEAEDSDHPLPPAEVPPAPEAAPEPEAPRDELHDSIDPQTGAATPEALAARASFMDRLREAGHEVHSWEEAVVLAAREGIMLGAMVIEAAEGKMD